MSKVKIEEAIAFRSSPARTPAEKVACSRSFRTGEG